MTAVTAPNTRPAEPVRMSMRTEKATGPFDGAWWPRSKDLTGEVGGLLAGMEDSMRGNAVRVTYNHDAWDPTGRRVAYHGRWVKLGWFTMTDPHLVTVSMSGGERVQMLVLSPDMAAGPAATAMAMGADGANQLDADGIISAAAAP